MIHIPRNRIAVVPIFDPTEGGAEFALRHKSMVRLPAYGGGVEEVEVKSGPIGLYIPDEARERCDQGIVKYVGPEVKEVKIGDYVIFSGYVGTLINVDGERLIILPEEFIQATLDDIPATDVSGLFFRGADGDYFTATYEQALELMARAFRDATWHKGFKVTSYRPSPEEYNKLKGGAG